MARCFSMPQIIHLVCHGIRKEGAVESKEVLARLARVSRIWSDVALDCLWYHIRGIDTLIRCMPQDLWSSSDSEGFVRPPYHMH
ncbi:hypothetical protein P691DRAFT_663180 [Macrolepiota fuliginosa MF-IS2]|uniref:F-box domain-containing protein n=1 Tax=Macrolepiota fuliginosa MF-IS2 TaxID=1400762 RepID=A0A9P6C7N0_9AGAR|nr:hypothetical protein P691DRAFT_663180 [Macrolepiota fuliginosa MF-IS2]